MAKILLTTIHRSFTNSVFAMLKEENGKDTHRIHVWPLGMTAVETGKYIVMTTYRDPRDVAESWSKRATQWKSGLWCKQWETWAKIIPIAERIYKLEDLDRRLGAMGQYEIHHNCKVPEADIKYAEDICKEIKEWL